MIKDYWKNIKPFGLILKILKNIELNSLPVYDDRFIKTKIRIYGEKVYNSFRGLNVPADDIDITIELI